MSLTVSEWKKVYQVLKAYDEGLLKNPSEEWESDYYDKPLADRKGLKPILKKIKILLPYEENGKIEKAILIRKYDTFNNEIDEGVYRKIEKAYSERKTIEINYFSMKAAQVKKREIDVYHKTRKYVIAYCHLRKDIRKFRTSRIVNAKLTDQPYKIPEDFDKNAY